VPQTHQDPMNNRAPLLTSDGDIYQRRKRGCNRTWIVVMALFIILLVVGLVLGFAIDWSDDSSPSIRDDTFWQNEFVHLPSNDSCKAMSVDLASSPHVAGKPEQIETGQYVHDIFESLSGFRAVRQQWNDTVLDHFLSSSMEFSVNGGADWVTLNISEEILDAVDNDTNTEYASHIWNAYSASAAVSGNVVYINYGRRSDYSALIENDNVSSITSNASFAGKIGLVRFGQMGRATKVKVAQQFGIAGLLIFSDPEDYAPDPDMVYPNGPWLPPSGVQRGSIKFASCPGNAEISRLQSLCGIDSIEDALPSIPVMPVSYSNAELLFESMTDGVTAPSEWQGGIDVDYKVDSEVMQLTMNVSTDLRTDDVTLNVYGIIDGEEFPDQIVMIGAHRDGWVCGAQDDISGTVTILEVAKGFGRLYESGWRPRRTMVFASWDSEESGLIGSVHFGEDLQLEDLDVAEGLIAYLNLDMTTGGDDFGVAGHPLLQTISEEAMAATPLLNPRLAVNASNVSSAGDGTTFYDYYTATNEQWGILGQGSDHTVFAFYVGIAAMDLGFGGATAWGAYHSMYDTNGWQETVDPDWMLAEDIARFTGVLSMKLLDSMVIPFDLSALAATMKQWFSENLMNAVTEYGCDPDTILNEDVTGNMLMFIEEFEDTANSLHEDILEVVDRMSAGRGGRSEEEWNEDMELVTQYNALLGSISKEFMNPDGLPARTWHKNILWNTAIEDGPSNVYPHIWYALQYECEEEMLREAFNVTQSLIDAATFRMQISMENVTERSY